MTGVSHISRDLPCRSTWNKQNWDATRWYRFTLSTFGWFTICSHTTSAAKTTKQASLLTRCGGQERKGLGSVNLLCR
jgi:hypothetical protein